MPAGGSGAATSSSSSGGTTTITTTTTRSGACERCHRRKVRCDKVQPQCSPCARAGAGCRYVTSEHQLRRRNVQRLESRIRELQSENQSLNGQLRQNSVEAGAQKQQQQQQRSSPPRRDPSPDVAAATSTAATEPTATAFYATPSASASVSAPTSAPASASTSAAPYLDGVSAGPAEGGEVADQVIHLSLIAGGGQHFVGSTSGLLLANLLQSRPHSRSAFPDVSSWHQQPGLIPDVIGGGAGAGAGHGARSGSSSPPSSLPSGLPPKNLARELIAAYCSHDHLCYPFISTTALSRSLEAVYDAAREGKAADPCDSFFVDMTLAIGTAQVHKFNWNGVYDAETHYNRAMTRLADVLGRDHGIARVQALLLVCQYRMGTTSSNTTTSVWHLIGVAARTCLELGLHRASAYALPQQGGGSPANQNGESDGSGVVEEMEIKRRCFWSLVALDRVTSLAMGRPFAIQLDDIEVDLPYVDATVSTDRSSAGVSLSSPVYGTPHWHLATSIFIHIVKYRLICGKILTSLHRHNKAHIGSVTEVDYEAVRNDLSRELQTWHAETANLPLVSSAVTSTSAASSSASTASSSSAYSSRVSSFRSEEWYRLLYHNGMLMLFRPSPCLNDATRNSLVLRRIFESSRESVNLYATLHRSRKMNYSWVTMHTVFMAGLSYIYALRNHLQALQTSAAAAGVMNGVSGGGDDGRATLQSTPTINQVVNDTRACSKVLVAVSERWDLARTCSELFDRLSDAVVADVVEATTNPAAPQHPSFPSSSSAHAVPPPPAVPQLGSNGNLGLSVADPGGSASFSGDEDMYGAEGASSAAAAAHGFINMSVDSTLRDCYPDLQNLGYDQYHNDAIAQLSQDWFFGIGDAGNRYF